MLILRKNIQITRYCIAVKHAAPWLVFVGSHNPIMWRRLLTTLSTRGRIFHVNVLPRSACLYRDKRNQQRIMEMLQQHIDTKTMDQFTSQDTFIRILHSVIIMVGLGKKKIFRSLHCKLSFMRFQNKH